MNPDGKRITATTVIDGADRLVAGVDRLVDEVRWCADKVIAGLREMDLTAG